MDVSNGTHNNAQTRQETFARTLNGCPSEAEYFSGMPWRLKELEHQNEQWKLENMKLYQDNASLLEMIQKQNERIRQIRAPDTEKNTKIIELYAELQKTRTERDELARAQVTMNRTPSQLHQDFLHLQGDYVRVLNGYRTLYGEVERLQGQVRLLTAHKHPSNPQPQDPQPQLQQRPQPQHHLHHQPQQPSRPQVQHPQFQTLYQPQPVHVQYPQLNPPVQRRSAPTLLQPHAQNYVQQHHQPCTAISRLQPSQQINIQSPPIIRQQQQQQHSLSQTQQAVFERHRSIVQSQQIRLRQSSGSNPAQDSFVDMANLQHHPPIFSGGQPMSRPNSKPHSNGIHAAQPISPVVLTMPDPLISPSRSSFSNKSGPPTPVVASYPPLNQTFLAPPSSNFNPDPPKIAMPPLNKVPSTAIEPSKPNASASVLPTKSPPDTVNQVRSPRVKDVQSFNTNIFSAETSFSPVEGPVASQTALGPHHQVKSLKRDSLTRSEGHHDLIEQQKKKPRLEGPQLELTQNISAEPVADGTEDTTQIDEDEDDDEDIIEVGPDGLRLVKDCLSDLFGEEQGEEEGRYCKLCIARRDMGYQFDPLKSFVNATNDELQEHCMTEHAEAWDTLRRSV